MQQTTTSNSDVANVVCEWGEDNIHTLWWLKYCYTYSADHYESDVANVGREWGEDNST